jgi:DNA-damage-inducible protein D
MKEILIKMEEEELPFEEYKHENGIPYWLASQFLEMLGYADMESFKDPMEKAKAALKASKIPIEEDFVLTYDNGIEDYKLSRFACYIIVMNADSKKEQVAQAQVYFAEQARKFEIIVQTLEQTYEDFERLRHRGEIADMNKSLQHTVWKAGVRYFDDFHNAGYRGLYNMYNFTLAKKRNIPPKSIPDHMGKTELAANLLSKSLTEEKIKNKQITGQRNCENAYEEVGKDVRDLVL